MHPFKISTNTFTPPLTHHPLCTALSAPPSVPSPHLPPVFMTSPSTPCPICSQQISGDQTHLQQHVNNHLDASADEASQRVAAELDRTINPHLSSQTSLPSHLSPAQRMIRELEESDAALASAMAAADLPDRSHFQPSLRSSLADSAEYFYPDIIHRVLPHPDLRDTLFRLKAHVASRLDLFSSNIAGMGWDCGFRNIQMLCSTLLNDDAHRRLLANAHISEVPSIPEIAARIEQAWQKGFDPEGASRFGGKLVDKEVWIGATEVYVLLRSINIPAFVQDFETPDDYFKNQMFEWIFDHFENWCKRQPCPFHQKGFRLLKKTSFIPPLFCQWPGHSLTIAGAERTRSGQIVLLVLDPARGFYQSLIETRSPRPSIIRRDIRHPQFQHPRFQLVSIPHAVSNHILPDRSQIRPFSRFLRGGAS